jgi:ABC-type uncharacterized transport system ATPase subunit
MVVRLWALHRTNRVVSRALPVLLADDIKHTSSRTLCRPRKALHAGCATLTTILTTAVTPILAVGAETTPRLELRGITKRFPGVLANDHIDLRVMPGEIHALLGENGAGKSTLVKIVDGLLQADEGTLLFEGEAKAIASPKMARALGIGMVFQHFSLFDAMSVAENIALGLDEAVPMRHLSTRISELAERYALALEPSRAVHTLSVGERQRVEILRCLMQRSSLLILDEPTSVLTPQEAERLFETLRQLRAEGRSVLYISHKLAEIKVLCDTATILRGGRVVGHCDPREETPESMARAMVGAELTVPEKTAETPGAPVLEIKGLTAISPDQYGTALRDISLTVHAGEIVGIAGVAGNGQSELVYALGGEISCSDASAIMLEGKALGALGPHKRRALGLACIPEDRLGEGSVPAMALADNVLLTRAPTQALTWLGFIRPGARDKLAATLIETNDVRCNGPAALASSLSGGNLQKFITGREMHKRPRILIAAQPTWGVDAGAAASIHQALIELAASGAAVLVISQELDELMRLSNRIAVIAEGRLSPAYPAHTLTPERIGIAMAGGNIDGQAAADEGSRGPIEQSSQASPQVSP